MYQSDWGGRIFWLSTTALENQGWTTGVLVTKSPEKSCLVPSFSGFRNGMPGAACLHTGSYLLSRGSPLGHKRSQAASESLTIYGKPFKTFCLGIHSFSGYSLNHY